MLGREGTYHFSLETPAVLDICLWRLCIKTILYSASLTSKELWLEGDGALECIYPLSVLA